MPLRSLVNVTSDRRGDVGCFTVECGEDDTVEQLKRRVHQQEGISPEAQQFVFTNWRPEQLPRRTNRPDRQPVAQYLPEDADSTATLRYTPTPADDPDYRVAAFPRQVRGRVLYLLDASGNMAGAVPGPGGRSAGKWDRLVAAFRDHLEELPDDAQFNVVFFADQCYEAFPEPVVASQRNVDAAMLVLEDVIPGGRPRLKRALVYALQRYCDLVDEIHLVLGGAPGAPGEKVIDEVVRHNLERFLPIHCVAFVPFASDFTTERFLLQLAKATGGSFRCPDLLPD
eukprot:EG_transcript_21315